MTAKILDGKNLAQLMRSQLAEKIAHYTQFSGRVPGLAVILVGDNAASRIYVKNKLKACAEVGIHSRNYELPTTTTQTELLALLDQLNHDAEVDGILIQLPLPPHMDDKFILDKIHPKKDVDGFHPYNLGRLAARRPFLRPSTPHGIMLLLNYYHIPLKGKHIVIVGASNIVGRPMALEALIAGATITVTHRFTENLDQHVSMADILVVAIGKPGIIKSAWLKQGVIIIDVGINRLTNGHLCGDIDFSSAKKIASWITPVPGGVGPMTVYGLLENTYLAACDVTQ